MSLEQQVANLVEASNNLTGSVNGKIGEIDQRMTDAESDYQSFKDDADERFQRSLSNSGNLTKLDLKHLDPNKYFAVVIERPQMLEVRVQRYVHDDGNGSGILDYFVRLQNWSAGGDFQFAIQEHHYYSARTFIGKISATATPYYSAIWLRGGWSYNVFLNGKSGVPRVIEDDSTIVESPSGNAYYAPPIDAVHASVVANGYIRGA